MKVLAIIDMQKDFIDGALGTKEAVAIVPKVAARLAQARADGETVAFTRDTHHADYLSTQEGRKLPVPHCLEGTDGWQIDAALAVEDAPVFDKPGFGSPALIEYLRSLPALEGVEFIGLCTDICVITNAMMTKGALPEVPLSVRADCCAGVTPQSHEPAKVRYNRSQTDGSHTDEAEVIIMLEDQDYQEIAHIFKVILESDIGPKINRLAEGQQLLLETLAPKNRVEELEDEVSFLKSVIRMHSEQIAELKKSITA